MGADTETEREATMSDSPAPSSPHVHGTPPVHPGIGGFFKNNTLGLPNWAWLLVIAAGIGAAIIIPKFIGGKKSGNATTTGTTPDSGLGLAIDPTTGLPYAVEGLVPAGGLAGGGGQGIQGVPGPTGPKGPPGTPAPPDTDPGPPGPKIKHATIRARDPKGTYDKQVAGGIPLRQAPGATKQVGLIPYGSSIQILGGPITGGGNFGRTGNTQWYQVPGGYISAFDIAKFFDTSTSTHALVPPTNGVGTAAQVPTTWPGTDTSQTRIL